SELRIGFLPLVSSLLASRPWSASPGAGARPLYTGEAREGRRFCTPAALGLSNGRQIAKTAHPAPRAEPPLEDATMPDRLPAFLLLAALALAGPAGAVTLDWVVIGAPGNAPDTESNCGVASCGSVPYRYAIGRLEVTNEQYAAFLNAVAADDPNGLYTPAMGSDARGGIVRTGAPGSYAYAVKIGREDDPVVFVSLWDAMRFANWLHNGQPTGPQGPGTTEDGAYELTEERMAANTVMRESDARFVVPD